MKLESQIKQLTELGLPLNAGVTIDDFLLSWSRDEYEQAPFDLILYAYGMEIEEEPWGRYVCDRAWNLDYECIEDNGDYVAIVNHFHRITGRARRLEELSDQVNVEAQRAMLKYKLDGEEKELTPKISNDWADADVVAKIMEGMCPDGYEFYGKDNGQAMVWFCMTQQNALALNDLADNVFNLAPRPWWKFW